MDGWQKVGAGLGAMFNPNAGEEAYRARLTENLTLEQKMAAAGQDRLKMMAVERIANDPNLDPMTRDLLVGQLGTQFSGVQQGRLHGQTYGFRDEAAAAARAGDWNALNPMLAVIDGKALKTNTIEGGGRFVGNTYDTDAGLGTTEFGAADIGRVNAATTASLARAGAAAAQANASNARGGSVDPGVYTTEDAMDAVEYNRVANRPGSGMTPIPVPVPGTPKGGAASPTSIIPQPPKIGDVLDGYRFNGGDPADPASWEKV